MVRYLYLLLNNLLVRQIVDWIVLYTELLHDRGGF